METRSLLIYLLILLLIWHIKTSSTESIIKCGNCRNEESALICPRGDETKYKLQLMPHEEEEDKFLQIDCDNLPILDFTHLEGCSFTSVEVIKLRFCPFFNDSFADIFGQIGVEPSKVTHLTVYYPLAGVFELSSTHLERLPNLAFLNLESAKLTHLSKDSFIHNPRIKMLYISGNHLKDLHKNIFDHLLDLEYLSMRDNELQEIPKSLFKNFKFLEFISFESNNVKHLPDTLLEELSALKLLSFYGNHLSTVPVNLLEKNSRLEVICFSYNELTNIPEQLFKANILLHIIQLDHNFISTLPQFLLKNLNHLKAIILSHNQINSLPENWFDGLTQLEVIELDNNKIVTLPDKIFRNCISLKSLQLKYNNLKVLRCSELPSVPTLIEIGLSNNQLSSESVIDENKVFALNLQTELQDVDLSYNNFHSFGGAIFGWSSFLKLKYLSFKGNYLRQIDFKEIFALPSDSTLDFANNKLEKIVGNIPASQKTVKIYLKDNNFTCDCLNYNLIRQIQESERFATFDVGNANGKSRSILNVIDKDNLTCQRPVGLSNQKLIYIKVRDLECSFSESPCSYSCPCTFTPFYKMITLKCANKNLTDMPDGRYLSKFSYTLDLSGNNLRSFNLSTDSQIINLNLSNNKLGAESFKKERNYLPMNLSILDLRGNNLTSLPSSFLSELNSTSSLRDIYLSSNPWVCDCDIKPLHDFIQVHLKKINDTRNIVCGMDQIPLIDLTDEDTCPITRQPKILGLLAFFAAILILIAVIGTASFYHYRTSIKIWLFTHRICLWLITEKEIDSDKYYDAFISYSHQDEEFVVNQLLDGLENGDPKYRICLHHRDWVGGESIQNQIINSVHNSKRTIVVLSKNFIESIWGQMEFKAAHQQALKDKTNRVIVIILGEMPPKESLDEELRLYISMHTYIESGHPKFWNSLRYAMPHSPYFFEQMEAKNVHPEMLIQTKLKIVDNKKKANIYETGNLIENH